jgi:replicative DNA helicase
MGKTVFSLNLADKLTSKYKVLFFELEMTDLKLGMRELAAKSYMPLNKLYEPHKLTEAEYDSIIKAVSRIEEKGNLTIDDKARASLDHIRNQVRYKKTSEGVDLVIVDHVGLIKMSKGFSNRNDWLGEVSSSLKAIAKEFDVCVIALSQLSREVEKRRDKRPELADLRESGNLEQDADCVMFLYREGYYKKTNQDNEPLEVIIAKNRDGRTGKIPMAINLKKQLVTEVYI